jgi:hypothetical protein
MQVMRTGHFLLALWLLGISNSCSGSTAADPRSLATTAASGIWTSTAAVGQLGVLRLALEQREETRVYDATLTFPDNSSLGSSDGFGTLADRHLILDFDGGDPNEYFLEAQVTVTGTTATILTGQLVFPDQAETLAVTFNHTSALPPG